MLKTHATPSRNRLTVHPAEQAHGDPSGVRHPEFRSAARRSDRHLARLLGPEVKR